MSRARVLVVEDDPSYQELYEMLLGRLHRDEFIGLLAKTGKIAFDQFKRHPSPPIDAVILDWQLSDDSGLSILKRIRANPATAEMIVFMVTGNAEERAAVEALQARANDYITKPFREEELCLKLRNHLEFRRQAKQASGVFTLDGLQLDFRGKGASLGGRPLPLRPKEFELLLLLMEWPGVLHSQEYLTDALSNSTDKTSSETIRQHISNLRKALGAWGEHIETRYGQGYVLHVKPPISQG